MPAVREGTNARGKKRPGGLSLNPFKILERLLKKIPIFSSLEEGIPLKAKILIAVLVLVSIFGASYTAYNLYDFTQNAPQKVLRALVSVAHCAGLSCLF